MFFCVFLGVCWVFFFGGGGGEGCEAGLHLVVFLEKFGGMRTYHRNP